MKQKRALGKCHGYVNHVKAKKTFYCKKVCFRKCTVMQTVSYANGVTRPSMETTASCNYDFGLKQLNTYFIKQAHAGSEMRPVLWKRT